MPASVGITDEVDHHVEPRCHEGVHGHAVETRGQAERLEPGRHVGRRVGVHGGGAAFVTRVERRQQVDDLRASHLTDDDPVGAHPQRLAHQVSQGDRAGAFDVRRSRLEPHDVRVIGVELGGVLDDDEPLPRVAQTQQHREPGRLAAARAPGDQQGEPRVDDGPDPRCDRCRHRADRHQLLEVEGLPPRYPQRESRAPAGHRSQHRVHAGAVGQPGIDIGDGVVQATTAGGGEALREPAHGGLVGEPDGDPLHSGSAIHPDGVGCGHEDIGDQRVAQQCGQGTGPGELVEQPRRLLEQHVGGEEHSVAAQRARDVGRGRVAAVGHEPGANPVENRGVEGHHRSISRVTSAVAVRPSRERAERPGGSPQSRAAVSLAS